MTLLAADKLRGGYGGADILNRTTLRVGAGEIVVVVGPNGAGKSTAMKALVGLVSLREGRITFGDEDVTGLRANQLAARKLCYVPQEKNVFASLTVLENLEMGAFLRRDNFSARMEQIFDLFPVLKERRKQAAGTMSGGQRQMVAIGRALMLEPRLLLLDEPTAGLSPKFTESIFAKIVEINAMGVAVLMVEQNARDALAIAHRGYVLVMGQNRFEDTGPALAANPEVAHMFLGG